MADTLPLSPLAPKEFAILPPLKGVRMAACEAGIKYAGRTDLLLMVFDEPAAAAGVFTTSRCPSAPVDWCREQLVKSEHARAVVVNAGNANAFTGRKGVATVEAKADAVAELLGCERAQVHLASTGVIGEPLDAQLITNQLPSLKDKLVEDGWHGAAEAIMTTDTYPKLATRNGVVGGDEFTINGIAKGSGMIAPDMATMLAYAVTDLPIAPKLLRSILAQKTRTTFNAVTVDSDTSTSDTLMLFATGTAGGAVMESESDSRYASFCAALEDLLQDLARQVVRDGEGATKEVQITVTGARDDRAAKGIALSIANSPLVKTAIAGEDANWGRVVMAVGKAGEEADRDRLAIYFGDVRVAVNGERDPHYSEEAASAVMKRDTILIAVDVGIAHGMATVWTCDLTKQYVAINGDYRS
ncbi:MAG: bifunctional glutamate N-acetyltransferase/amino-acid acetyltransferase ArgJ [Pseudomonadota bacterium]